MCQSQAKKMQVDPQTKRNLTSGKIKRKSSNACGKVGQPNWWILRENIRNDRGRHRG